MCFSVYTAVAIASVLTLNGVHALATWMIIAGISAIIAFIISIYANKADTENEDLSPAQRSMSLPDYQYVSMGNLRKVLSIFQPSPPSITGGEPVIVERLVWVSRQTVVYLWVPWIWSSLLFAPVIWIAAGSRIEVVGIPDATSVAGGVYDGLSLPDPPIGYLMFAIVAWIVPCFAAWVRWSSVYVVLTRTRLIKVVRYPKWLYWIGDETPDMQIRKIDTKKTKRTSLGKLFGGYGALGPDTASQEDEVIRSLTGIPKIQKFAGIVAELQNAA